MTEEEKDTYSKAKSSFHSRSGSVVSGVGSGHNRVATKTIYAKPRNNYFTMGNTIENTRLNQLNHKKAVVSFYQKNKGVSVYQPMKKTHTGISEGGVSGKSTANREDLFDQTYQDETRGDLD